MKLKKVLIVDDDQGIHLATKYVLRGRFDCASAYTSEEARAIAGAQRFDVVLLDLHLAAREEGLGLLPSLKALDPDLEVIVVSASNEIEVAGRAIALGASAYLIKEHSADQLLITMESVLKRRELARENQHYVRDRQRTLDKSRILGESPAIKQLLKDIEKVRRSRSNVVIFAETGCGKELVARHIGAADGRPFVAVDSATITSSMAESILFGHEPGAFTGAAGRAKGLFEEADGGTIYLDEIANMPLEIQPKLLRAIQEKEISRLGSAKIIPLDFRVVCATNKDLERLVEEGRFKEDLFQRLNVITLRIPPLRERAEDITLLTRHFLEANQCEGSPKSVSDEAMALLMKYRWPGNVRELSNLMANLCAMLEGKERIEAGDLPEKIRGAAVRCETAVAPDEDFHSHMRRAERDFLARMYGHLEGNVSRMSRALGLSRSHLYTKLQVHGLHE